MTGPPVHRSGFIAVVGRTGVGKSSLVNAMVGEKVSITSRHPNTTRIPVRACLNRPGVQAVFVDTPGIHRPRTVLGTRLNDAALSSLPGVDVCVVVVDATAPIGPGDRRVAAMVDRSAICAVNKIDTATRAQVVQQLDEAASWSLSEYFPVSARTGEGVDALAAEILGRVPEGPAYFDGAVLSDTPEAHWVAELVREELLARLRDELPHSVACRVIEWDGPHITCEIIVERPSQKGIVIGRGGSVLKDVGTAVRHQLDEGTYIELVVRVEKDWQGRADVLDALGYGGA